MTTGRINQVTTFRNHFRGRRSLAARQGHPPLSRRGVCQPFSFTFDPPQLTDTFPPAGAGDTSDLEPTNGVTLLPVLTRLRRGPLVP